MCIFGGSTPPPPPPLPPAPPPPAPPRPTPEPEMIKDVNPNVSPKTKAGKKLKNQYSQGTGSLKIKLNPKLNTGSDQTTGGLN
jgi:hypothetical protein